jgi:hypothetical protein
MSRITPEMAADYLRRFRLASQREVELLRRDSLQDRFAQLCALFELRRDLPRAERDEASARAIREHWARIRESWRGGDA